MSATTTNSTPAPAPQYTKKDFVSDQDVRWCPGCGDYAILNEVQKLFPKLGYSKEKYVVVSGIGCSSRFPYYMNTYGFHSIHGRAPAIATGVKCANPDLQVWVITGDGDGLSIGGNHLIHAIRRNVGLKILLINNRIYGLTKGQYSPTSEKGKVTKSSPLGTIEQPINPLCIALAAEATFVARSVDTDSKHLGATLEAAARHKGTAFVEIYQNCVIFNDDAFVHVKGVEARDERVLHLEHGKPMVFGKNRDKGIRLNGINPEVVEIKNGDTSGLLLHDSKAENPTLSYMLTRMDYPEFPVPMGVFRDVEHPSYDEMLKTQIEAEVKKRGKGDLRTLLHAGSTWTVE